MNAIYKPGHLKKLGTPKRFNNDGSKSTPLSSMQYMPPINAIIREVFLNDRVINTKHAKIGIKK